MSNVTPVTNAPAASIVDGRDVRKLSARQLASSIAEGTIRAREAVEAYIARIEQVNGALNAVVVRRYDEARAEADAVDQKRARGETLPPLAGVPITVKECFNLAGTPATFGLSARKQARVATDDPYVARLRAAGAIVIAKTNVAQLLENKNAGETPAFWQYFVVIERISANRVLRQGHHGRPRDRRAQRRDLARTPASASSATILHAATSCGRAFARGAPLRPFHGPSSRRVFRNGRGASSRGKSPRAASSFSAP